MDKSSESVQKVNRAIAVTRQRFLRLSSREKVLILLVMGVLFYYWASNHFSRQSRLWSDIGLANITAASQQQLIDEEPSVRVEWEKAIDNVVVEDLPTRGEVQGRLDEIARRYTAGGRFSFRPQNSEVGDPLSFHSFQLEVNRIDHGTLMKLIDEVQTGLPYVTLLGTTIRVAGSSGAELNATFKFRSIEYTK